MDCSPYRVRGDDDDASLLGKVAKTGLFSAKGLVYGGSAFNDLVPSSPTLRSVMPGLWLRLFHGETEVHFAIGVIQKCIIKLPCPDSNWRACQHRLHCQYRSIRQLTMGLFNVPYIRRERVLDIWGFVQLA